MGGSLVLPFDHMLEFQNGEIELYAVRVMGDVGSLVSLFGTDFTDGTVYSFAFESGLPDCKGA
ncbi:MAG: hypothetical protein U5R49_06885 [Deltaproteobacteria bacterium]|nr:hypothetical protein [Deltaproteobacteria bacterium]